MAITPGAKRKHWIEYTGTHNGIGGCTILTSCYEEYGPIPTAPGISMDEWVEQARQLIFEEHPEATNLRLMRRDQVTYPPPELVREIF